jgi:hypothetical protein
VLHAARRAAKGAPIIPPLAHARQFKRLDASSTTGAVRRRGGSPRFRIANRSAKKAASRRLYDKRN